MISPRVTFEDGGVAVDEGDLVGVTGVRLVG